MRIYSETERKMIRYLNCKKRGERNIQGILDQYLERVKICLDIEDKTAVLLFEKPAFNNKEFERVIDKAEELQELLLVLLKCIEFLDKNGFVAIYSITPNASENPKMFGKGIDEECTLRYEFSDKNIVSMLFDYIYKEIVPLGSLRRLENDKFRSPTDNRFRSQQIASWVAISLAFLVGVFGIALNICSSTQQSSVGNERLLLEKRALHNIEQHINKLEVLEEKRISEMKKVRELLAEVPKLIHNDIEK